MTHPLLTETYDETEDPKYCQGTTLETVPIESSVEVVAPADANYLYIYGGLKDNLVNYYKTPQIIKNIDINEKLEETNKRIDSLCDENMVLGESVAYSLYSGYIGLLSSSASYRNKFIYTASYKHRAYQVVPNERIEIKANSSNETRYCFLTSNIYRESPQQYQGQYLDPNFAAGWLKVEIIPAGEILRLNVPSNATILYTFEYNTSTTSNTYAPEYVKRLVSESTDDIVELTKGFIRNGISGDVLDVHPRVDVQNIIRNLLYRGGDSFLNWGSFVFAHITDCHGDDSDVDSAKTLKRFTDFVSYYQGISERYILDMVNTGDTVSAYLGNGESFVTADWYKTDAAKKILTVVGNHDTADYINEVYRWTNNIGQNAYNFFIKDCVDNWNVNQPESAEENGYCYYSKDYTLNNENLKAIFIDYMDWQNASSNDRHNSLSYHQAAWVKQELDAVLVSNATVIIFVHDFPGSVRVIDCSWSRNPFALATTENYGGTYSTDYYYLAELIHNFQVSGGNFACYVTGHRHGGNISQLTGTYQSFDDVSKNINYDDGRYPQLVITGVYTNVKIAHSSANGETSWRLVDTENQDSFRLIAINTANKYIKVVQIGNNVDMRLKTKDYLCLYYGSYDNFSEDMTLPVNPLSTKYMKGNALWRFINIAYKEVDGVQVIDWDKSDKVLTSRVINQ